MGKKTITGVDLYYVDFYIHKLSNAEKELIESRKYLRDAKLSEPWHKSVQSIIAKIRRDIDRLSELAPR